MLTSRTPQSAEQLGGQTGPSLVIMASLNIPRQRQRRAEAQELHVAERESRVEPAVPEAGFPLKRRILCSRFHTQSCHYSCKFVGFPGAAQERV